MNVTISLWMFPTLLTVFLLLLMFRPIKGGGDYNFGVIFRLFYIVPISVIWAIYFFLAKIVL